MTSSEQKEVIILNIKKVLENKVGGLEEWISKIDR